MNIQQAKTVAITDILAHFGHFPMRSYDNGREYTYFSPFRPNENTASFDVNIEKNLACDRGQDNLGGDPIRIVQMLCRVSVSDALDIIERTGLYRGQSNYVAQHPIMKKGRITKGRATKKYSIASEQGESTNNNSEMVVDSIQTVQHPILKNYLQYRCIDFDIANNHGLKEINYHYSNLEDNKYFALAWKDDKGGYELNRRGSHKNFKGCIGEKTITSFINTNNDKLAVFEGFLDFLSFLTYFNITKFESSAIILNGTGQVDQALDLIGSIKNDVNEIYLFFDNDESGEKAKAKLLESEIIKNKTIKDKSEIYKNHKDFNDFIMQK